MREHSISKSTPITIGIYYLAWMATGALLCIRLAGMQTILTYAVESKPYAVLFTEYCNQDLSDTDASAKVVCFGDSTSFLPPDYTAFTGDYEVHMHGLIRAALNPRATWPAPKFSEWAFPAASMYDYYCMYYKALESSPDLIVVPINWICFGSHFIDDPRWFHPELSALTPVRGELSPQVDPIRTRGISVSKQLEYRIYLHLICAIGIKNFVLKNVRSLLDVHSQNAILSKQLAKQKKTAARLPAETTENKRTESQSPDMDKQEPNSYFPMRIESSNPTFQSLCALADVASKRKTKLLLYVWPMDQEFLAHIGIMDKSEFERSKQLIIKATQKENVYFMDLSNLLRHGYFSDPFGHCTVEGRRRIAAALAPKVAEILKETRSAGK
jgi:hypothetical protein